MTVALIVSGVALVIGLILFLAWCLCKVAKSADEQAMRFREGEEL